MQIEDLAKAGAFDRLDGNRARVFAGAETVLRRAQASTEEKGSGRIGLFGEPGRREELRLPDVPDWMPMDRLGFEAEAIGFHLTAHPLDPRILAAERRAEMGVARALGTARGHLVQSFLFEGAVYDLVAAALGVGAGLAIGNVLTALISGSLTALGVSTAGQVQPRSLAVAYSLGALCTGLTVTIASWWIGRLNIVAAMRGLPGDRPGGGAPRRCGGPGAPLPWPGAR